MALPIIAALIGGAASLASSAISSSAAKKASSAATQAANDNNALLRAFQDRAYQTIDPYLQTGYGANSALARLVGGSGYAASGSGANPLLSAASGGGVDWNAYLQQNPDAAAWVAAKSQEADAAGKTPAEMAAWHYQLDGSRRELPTIAAPAATPSAEPTTYMGNPQYGPALTPRVTTPRPTMAPLDVSVGSYQQSPDYEFQLDQGNRNILAKKAQLGQLESGDAMKALQKFGQDLAMGDYAQWRNYATNQYNVDRDVLNRNYDIDESRSDARYDADRGYLTGRFDTQINDLFRIANQGLGAAGSAIGVGQNVANSMGANNNSAATATGNAALYGANNVNQMLGAALNLYGQFAAPQSGGQSQTTLPPAWYTSPTYSGNYLKL